MQTDDDLVLLSRDQSIGEVHVDPGGTNMGFDIRPVANKFAVHPDPCFRLCRHAVNFRRLAGGAGRNIDVQTISQNAHID